MAVALPAAAQDVAAAEALFNRGFERMEAGEYEKACPPIAESHRLDPRPGTLFTLAECEARRGRIATAFVRYGDYLALYDSLPPEKRARQADRAKAAREQRAALGPQVPELALVLAPGVPRGTVIKRDGVVLDEPSLGVGLPVDPGEHVITIHVPGRTAVERRVTLAPREKKQVLLDEKEEPPAAPPKPPPAPPVVKATPPPAPAVEPRRGPSARRIAAYATGGAGIAGVVAGAVIGGLAVAKKGALSANCGLGGDPNTCNDEGLAARDAGRALGNGSTVALVAGGALLATGVALFFTEPRQPSADSPKTTAGRWMSAGVLSIDGNSAIAGLRGGF